MEQFRLCMERLLSTVLCGSYNDQKVEDSSSTTPEPYKLVVAIDDLDRCLPEQALEVFEAIKLFLDLPRTNFIVALDQDIIQHALDIRYMQGTSKRPQINAVNYIEKMIDLSFSIPSQLESNFLKYVQNELPDGDLLVKMYDTLNIALPINLRTWDRFAVKASFNKKILEKIYKNKSLDSSEFFNNADYLKIYFKLQCLSYRWPEVFRKIGSGRLYGDLELRLRAIKIKDLYGSKDLPSDVKSLCNKPEVVPDRVWSILDDITLIKYISSSPYLAEAPNDKIEAIFSLDQ